MSAFYPASQMFIELLRQAVAEKSGINPSTPRDFTILSLLIEESGIGRISDSTLKRIWNYSPARRTHKSTLDVLARYVGYRSYDDYENKTRNRVGVQSGFPTGNVLNTDTLPRDCHLQLSWLPDRLVRLRHINHYDFEVVESLNSKLRPGWLIRIPHLINGMVLMADVKRSPDSEFEPFVAGSSNGVIWSLG